MRREAGGGEAPLDPHVLEQAADWLLRLGDRDATAADHAACLHWQQQHPAHARAWARAEHLRDLIARVPPALARPVLDRPACIGRRAALKQLAVALAALPGGWLAWRLWDQAQWDQTQHTARGERRAWELPDGSQVELDSDTTLDIAFGRTQRLLRLRSGQVMIDTARDPQSPPRPFRVATAHGRMQALGTRFNVRVDVDCTWLSVVQGAVQVQPGGRGDAARRIDAGQSVRFDSHRCATPSALDPAASAWLHGMLAADALPLAQLVDALGRYRRGVLGCDARIAALPISGAFPLDDTDRSLAMLAATYPVAVARRAGGWWTTLVPRDG